MEQISKQKTRQTNAEIEIEEQTTPENKVSKEAEEFLAELDESLEENEVQEEPKLEDFYIGQFCNCGLPPSICHKAFARYDHKAFNKAISDWKNRD